MNTSALIKLLIALFVIASICSNASAQTLQEHFETAAKKIKSISYYEFLNSERLYTVGTYNDLSEKDWQRLREVTSIAATLEELTELMEHSNPRVRTLAMLRAYRLEVRESFVIIQRRINDNEKGIPAEDWHIKSPEWDSSTGKLVGGSVSRISEDITVSEIAKDLINTLGYLPDQTIKNDTIAFDDWTKSHLFNPHWIRWYTYLYRNSGGYASNKLANSPQQISKLKAKINQLDSPLREWVIINFNPNHTSLLTEEDVVTAMKTLGENSLMAYIENGTRLGLNSPTDKKWGNRKEWPILNRSESVFSSKSANRLAKLGYYIAAADADPSQASIFMRKGLISMRPGIAGFCVDKPKAAAVLLEYCGDKESAYITELLFQGYQAEESDRIEWF
ncbi:MAG: hypothetical protein GXP30_01790, partial [Verrucomicrobia bacterium]|nr:hypothetical protein [Verrucomicrobiota bacterium]